MATVGLGPAANGWSKGSTQMFGEDAFNTPNITGGVTIPLIGRFPWQNYATKANIFGYPPLHWVPEGGGTISTVSAPYFLSLVNLPFVTPGAPVLLYQNLQLIGGNPVGLGFTVNYTDSATYTFEVQDSGTGNNPTIISTTNSYPPFSYPGLQHVIVVYNPLSSDIGVTPISSRMSIYINGLLQPTTVVSNTGNVTDVFGATTGPANVTVGGIPNNAICTKLIENYGNIAITPRTAWQLFYTYQRYLPPPGQFAPRTTPSTAPVFVVPPFEPPLVPVSNLINIFGSLFTGATAVSINGTAATFTVIDDNLIQAVVPTGATTGTISVTTPHGTSVTSGSIIIAPVWAPQITQH